MVWWGGRWWRKMVGSRDGSPEKVLHGGEEEGLKEKMVVADSNWQDMNKNWVKMNTGEKCDFLCPERREVHWVPEWTVRVDQRMDADENGWGGESWRGVWNRVLMKMTIREETLCSVAAFTSLQNKNYIIFSVSLWPVKELKNQSSGISIIT